MPESITCREFIEFLDAYFDGSMSAERRGVFDAHLGVCSHCRAYLDEYRATVRLARSLGRPVELDVDHTQAPLAILEAVRKAIVSR